MFYIKPLFLIIITISNRSIYSTCRAWFILGPRSRSSSRSLDTHPFNGMYESSCVRVYWVIVFVLNFILDSLKLQREAGARINREK